MIIRKITIQQAALACLLFFAVFQALNLFLNGEALLALSYIAVGAWISKHLVSSNQGNKLNNRQSVVILLSIWLLFSYIVSQQSSLSIALIGWMYLLIICSHILLIDQTLNKVSAALTLPFLLCLYFSSPDSQSTIQYLLSVSVFLVLINLVTRYILALQEDLNIANTKDSLTGCNNLAMLKKEINKAVELQKRYDTAVSAIQIEIHYHFPKRHLLESCIKEVAQICQTRLRQTDTLCRQSDYRFIILLPSTQRNNAASLANDLLEACNAYNFTFLSSCADVSDSSTKRPEFTSSIYEFYDEENSDTWFHQLTS